ncbi:hypothetical protein MYA_0415 [Burkholderia sp. KJ006]|nr:hypothetical protein MYA_0415 [Burkholderia sp. KJ006]
MRVVGRRGRTAHGACARGAQEACTRRARGTRRTQEACTGIQGGRTRCASGTHEARTAHAGPCRDTHGCAAAPV